MSKPKKLRALSLFSGAGGMDIGVKNAGFHVEACIELDKFACETLRWNNKGGKGSKVIEGDICNVDPSTLAESLHIRKGELSLLFGGPPCQSFSLAGKQKGLADDRGKLLFEIIRFARDLQPHVILLEQVKGLLSAKDANGKRGGVFESFLSHMEAIGYVPKWQVVLAADFGVPQMRERLFVVATRGKNGFVFPERTHAELRECNNHNGPGINYRQVWARMVSQLIVKSQVGMAWGGRTIWVLQDLLADYISKSTALDLEKYISTPPDEVNILAFGYGENISPNKHNGHPIELTDSRFYAGPVSKTKTESTGFIDIVKIGSVPPKQCLWSSLFNKKPSVVLHT